MKQIRKRILVLALCVLTVLSILPAAAVAAGKIEMDRDVAVTLSYKVGDTAIGGARFDIYRVADVDEYARMTVTSAFSSSPANTDLSAMDTDAWSALALTLKGYVFDQGDKLTPETVYTDDAGQGTAELKPGLYLVVGSRRTIDDTVYSAEPFMLFVPGENKTDNVWEYAVTVCPKCTSDENPDEDPDARYITRRALKIWDDTGYETERPESVTVKLFKDGKLYDTQELSAKNNWRYSWDELEADHDWTVYEEPVEGYYTLTSFEGITFIVKNSYILPVGVTDPPVVKKITGDTPASSSKFTFTLQADDSSFPMPEGSTDGKKTVTVTGAGSTEFGEIVFTKAGTYTYKIYENDTGITGYTYDDSVYTLTYEVVQTEGELTVTGTTKDPSGNTVLSSVFTNKYTTPGSKLPQTGMLWWPVPILFSAGLLFCILGLFWRKNGYRQK